MTKSRSGTKLARAEGAFILRGGMPGDYHLVAPWCMGPVPITIRADRLKGRPHAFRDRRMLPSGKQIDRVVERFPDLGIKAACRRCSGCLKHKRRLWAARAYHESLQSFRTWFGTLTFPLEIHQEAIASAMAQTWADGVDHAELSEAARLAVESEVLYRYVDRFWKRLRAQGYRFRYLCVAEPHESGLVHFHVLVHEITPHQLPKAKLEEQWRTGLSHWRLVKTGDRRAVFYVCKYLAKEAENRPRSSLHYGAPIKIAGLRSNRHERLPAKASRDVGGTDLNVVGKILPSSLSKTPNEVGEEKGTHE